MKKIFIYVLIAVSCICTACSSNNNSDNSASNKSKNQSNNESNNESNDYNKRNIISFDNKDPECKLKEFVQQQHEEVAEPDFDLLSNYTNEYTIQNQLYDKKANYADVIQVGEYTVACDIQNNCLTVLDNNLKIIKTIGTIGSNALEFIQPCSIDIDSKGYIYVLDYGNYRIQVLNDKFEYVKEINAKFIEENYYMPNFNDFAVDSKGEYAYVIAGMIKPALVSINLSTGEYHNILEYTLGSLTKNESNILYIENGELTSPKSGIFESRSGINYMYILQDDKVKSKIQLTDSLLTTSVAYVNGSILLASGIVPLDLNTRCFGNIIHKFDEKGAYICSPFGEEFTVKTVTDKHKPENADLFIYKIASGKDDSILLIYDGDKKSDSELHGGIMVLRKK